MQSYIIGTGVMGSAIAKTLAESGHSVFVNDVNIGKARQLAKHKNIVADKDFGNLRKSDFVILAVKPYHLAETADQVKNILSDQVIISIAAGTTIAKIKKLFGQNKIVRVMPNLGLSVGQGIAAWKSVGLSKSEKASLEKLLDCFTENFEVRNENLIDAVTAISGSGPAYFFAFAEGLEKAAKHLGFSAKQARGLVEKTFTGAAALQQNQAYADLITQVASKKGTTEAALNVFSNKSMDKIIEKAVRAAFKRAQQISKS